MGPYKRQNIPEEIIGNDGNILTAPSDILNKWKHDFKDLYQSIDYNFENEFLQELILYKNFRESLMLDPLCYSDNNLNKEISVHEVSNIVLKAKNGKAVGIDKIPNEVLKNNTCILFLKCLFNLCFDTGKSPGCWHDGIIVPVPKSKTLDPRIPLNYRGISLLCTSSKLYSSLLNKRLLNFLESNHLLADEQNGFRQDRSCLDHIYSLTTVIKNRLANNLDTYVCFIDFKKAFDFINRDMLLVKLLNLGINGKMYLALKNMLINTRSCVKINDKYTEFFHVLNGVRQGDPISSSLFSVYINDLVSDINTLKMGINIGEDLVSLLLYADDLVLMAPDGTSLQKMLDSLNTWAIKWRVTINLNKSNVIHFRKIRKHQTEIIFKLGGEEINKTSEYKYLGLILDEHLKLGCCAETIAASASRALVSVISKFKSFRDMGYETYTTLFNVGVIPILNYCCPVWHDKGIFKLEQVQNRAIRVFMGIHRFAPIPGFIGDMGWLPLRYTRQIELLRYWNKLIKMDNDRLTKKNFQI